MQYASQCRLVPEIRPANDLDEPLVSPTVFFTTCYNSLSGSLSLRLNARFLNPVPSDRPRNTI
jgi:hypothetical protein